MSIKGNAIIVGGGGSTPSETKSVALDMASGDQIITPTAGKLLSQVTVQKPNTLIASNIRNGVNIGGEIGTLVVPEPIEDGFCYTALGAAGSCGFEIVGAIENPPTLEYKLGNNGVWTPYTIGTMISVEKDQHCYFRGDNSSFSFSYANYMHFFNTSVGIIDGNIMYLLDKTGESLVIPNNYCFYYLFSNDAGAIFSLALPATTLRTNCYSGIFSGCTSLVNAPSLPATTLASNCYREMFSGCTSLVNAPSLPATTLALQCYYSMFSGCTSLVNVPSLPATTLASNCYYSMFSRCKSLISIEVAFTSWAGTSNWLSNVAKNGTFKCPSALGTDTTITRGVSNCPTGWTVINTD